jgi:hypothetical protein
MVMRDSTPIGSNAEEYSYGLPKSELDAWMRLNSTEDRAVRNDPKTLIGNKMTDNKEPVYTIFENNDAELVLLLLALLKRLLVGVSEAEALVANSAADRLLAKYSKAVSTPETVKDVWDTRG